MTARQTTLLDPAKTPVIDIPVMESTGGEIATIDPTRAAGSALLDFRTGYMLTKPDVMKQALAEYVEIRDVFREWLLARMVVGVHYGYPPGCAPKYCDAKGKPCDKAVAWGTLGYKNSLVSLAEWTPKHSLYKAGAEMVCDLLWARGQCESDIAAWQMMGSKEGVLVRTCKLYSKINGDLLGQGTGSRLVGQRGGDNNTAIITKRKESGFF